MGCRYPLMSFKDLKFLNHTSSFYTARLKEKITQKLSDWLASLKLYLSNRDTIQPYTVTDLLILIRNGHCIMTKDDWAT